MPKLGCSLAGQQNSSPPPNPVPGAGFPGLVKYSPAELAAKCQVLAGLLGGPREASALLTAAPALLHVSRHTLHANIAFLRHELGWSAQQVAQLARQQWRTFGTVLTSPEMRRMLALCEEVLGLAPAEVFSKHPGALFRAPEDGVARLAFVAQRGLRGRLKTCRFVKDGPREWARRLQGWGVQESEWATFVEAYWASQEGAQLLLQMQVAAADSKAAKPQKDSRNSVAARSVPAAIGQGAAATSVAGQAREGRGGRVGLQGRPGRKKRQGVV